MPKQYAYSLSVSLKLMSSKVISLAEASSYGRQAFLVPKKARIPADISSRFSQVYQTAQWFFIYDPPWLACQSAILGSLESSLNPMSALQHATPLMTLPTTLTYINCLRERFRSSQPGQVCTFKICVSLHLCHNGINTERRPRGTI